MTKSLMFRLPDDLHERLVVAAASQHRSLNAQIIIYIERGLAADERRDGPAQGS